MGKSIFISYRRIGSSWSTRSLHDRLRAQYGKDHVFMDVTDIDYGSDFAEKIATEIGRCDVVLVVIGPQWLSAADAKGNRRLDDPDDYVRLEIGMGLKRRIPVVPILVDGASMPQEEALPDDLKALSRRNAIELRHSHFDGDIQLLLDSLQEILGPAREPKTDSLESAAFIETLTTRTGLLGILALVVVTLLAVVFLSMNRGDDLEIDVRPGANVGDVTINQGSDPALIKLVEDTVSSLVDQLERKDEQIQIRDAQTQQLSSAVAALVGERDRPDAPPGLENALENLANGDTEAAKAIFRQVLNDKSAEAMSANRVAADAAKHLGALAALSDEQEAAKAYERAVELSPDDAQAQNLLAAIQKKSGRLRLQAALMKDAKPVDACFTVYHSAQDLDGKREKVTYSCTKTADFTLDAGKYFVHAYVGNASANQEFEIAPGQLINTTISLEAGQLRLQAAMAQGSEPAEACFTVYHWAQDLDGKREKVTYSCTKTVYFTLDAGKYFVHTYAGNASANQEFEVAPGQLINTTISLEAGRLRLQAAMAQGSEPVEACFTVYHWAQDLDGKREKVTYSCTKTADFTLDAGKYFVHTYAGNASADQEFEVTPGQLINTTINLEAGRLRLQAALAEDAEPVEACFTVYHWAQDLDGKREKVTYSCTKTADFTLDAGKYFVHTYAGNASADQEFEVTPGQLINTTINLEAGQLRLQAALAEDVEPVEACFTVYHSAQDLDGEREKVTYSCTKTVYFTLDAGKYFVLARAGNASTAREFEIIHGQLINQRMILQEASL